MDHIDYKMPQSISNHWFDLHAARATIGLDGVILFFRKFLQPIPVNRIYMDPYRGNPLNLAQILTQRRVKKFGWPEVKGQSPSGFTWIQGLRMWLF